MDYSQVTSILNQHIFKEDKASLLRNVADNPERFIGFFRPTKPKAKILQYLLHSHEIRFGDAIEKLINMMIREMGFKSLEGSLIGPEKDRLFLDQYFTDGNDYYFVEQKVRDDHDSTKKRGQIRNFESKLEILSDLHPGHLIGIMYFVDPDLDKNKRFYVQELNNLSKFYRVPLFLYYGPELFNHFGQVIAWKRLIEWLKQWKADLPELPEVDFDLDPDESFAEIRDIQVSTWRRFITDDRLWDEGIVKVLFKRETTLRLIQFEFSKRTSLTYHTLSEYLKNRLDTYY